MAKDGERLRVLAPEVRDMDIDDALEEAWGAVGARQGSNRSKVSIVHFDNGKSKECQYEWISGRYPEESTIYIGGTRKARDSQPMRYVAAAPSGSPA